MARCVCQRSKENDREQCPNLAKHPAPGTTQPLIYCGIHISGTCRLFKSPKLIPTKEPQTRITERQNREKIERQSRVIQLTLEQRKRMFDENPELYEIVQQHLKPSSREDPATTEKSIIYEEAQLQLIPSLQQARTERDQTNYCGYYVLHNILSVLSEDMTRIRNRERFAYGLLLPTLIQVKKIRHSPSYDNLDGRELRAITRHIPEIAIIERSSLFLYPEVVDSLVDALDGDHKSASLIEDFIEHRIDQVGIIALLATPEARSGGHWIAMIAEHRQGRIILKILDSIHPIEWYLSNPQLMKERVLPYYYALTGQWIRMKQEFNQLGGFRYRC